LHVKTINGIQGYRPRIHERAYAKNNDSPRITGADGPCDRSAGSLRYHTESRAFCNTVESLRSFNENTGHVESTLISKVRAGQLCLACTGQSYPESSVPEYPRDQQVLPERVSVQKAQWKVIRSVLSNTKTRHLP
jgi:hypothetical protein